MIITLLQNHYHVLCMPVILGLSWLEFNKIVCDHADHLCYVKNLGYNLLNSPIIEAPSTSKPKPNLKIQLSDNCWLKKLALEELVLVVHGIDVTASMHNRITTLSVLQDMEICENSLKTEFS